VNEPYQLVIDTWAGQLEISESVLLANNVAGMVIRLNSTSGKLARDINFDKQWNEARAFARAPYYVYYPFVSGFTNFTWLQANMPTDARAVLIDIEIVNGGYPATTYAVEVGKFLNLVKAKWNYAIYTGQGYIDLLSPWPMADYWWAQYLNEFYPASPMVLTWDELRARLAKYNTPTNARYIPGRLRMWQLSGDKLILPGNPKPIDVSVFYGSLQDLYNWLGAPVLPPVPTDTKTTPHDGMTRISGQRNGYEFHLFISDPAKVDFEVVCCSPLETVSSVSKRKGATLGVNGGEWDRVSKPKDYTVSNGDVCQPRVEAVPSLIIGNGQPIIDYQSWSVTRQAISGLRYLIRDGTLQPYLFGTEPQYTEGHARSIHGINANGFHMVLQSEGVYPNQGLTLKQAAEIMKQYGAVTAFDSGGGGDVTCYFEGQSLILPENINPATGAHFERPLPSVLLIYAKDTNTMNGTAKEILGNVSTIRKSPSRYGADTGKRVPAWATLEFVDIADVIPQGTADNVADKWLKLPDGNYVNYILAGKEYYNVVTMPSDTPPDPQPKKPVDVKIMLAAGSTVITTYSDGTQKVETA